jgi:hypothetical protein
MARVRLLRSVRGGLAGRPPSRKRKRPAQPRQHLTSVPGYVAQDDEAKRWLDAAHELGFPIATVAAALAGTRRKSTETSG